MSETTATERADIHSVRNIVLLSIPLFIAHGFEEALTGIHTIDSQVMFAVGWMPFPVEVSFYVFQATFWIALLGVYFLLAYRTLFVPLAIAIGIIYLYELHHVYKAAQIGGYYPGLISSMALYVVGFFFWKKLLKKLLY